MIVRDIPESAKLVVVVGPNGCGKSSLFDALLQWYRSGTGFGFNSDILYYRKDPNEPFDWTQSIEVKLVGDVSPHRGCLYVRSAYRNDPDFSIGGIGRPSSPSDNIKLGRIIDNDQTVSENYQRLVYDTMAGVYDTKNDEKSVSTLREELIGEVRHSMRRVFGDLVLNNISDPLGSGAFYFDKGSANGYHYKNLSGGEKAAFDLLLDLHIKKRFYSDAVYCIDEMETHLHTRIQGLLLKEMVKILPEGAQLWVTTHSLGVLRAAQEMAADRPGNVAIIDFDAEDPDVPREIVPSNLGRVTWEKLLSIALDDLTMRVAPRIVVVCEGSTTGNRRKDFDAEIYNRVLASQHPDILFISGGASNQILASGVSIRKTLSDIVPTASVRSMCDRDDKSDAEVAEFEINGDLVLANRNLESYLLADDVIEALVVREGKEALLPEAMKIKSDAISNSVGRGNPRDDLKSAAGEIFIGLRRLLELQRCGNTTDMFMRDTLAPLIVAPMATYYALKAAVIDRLPTV
ncbi:energy-coupling factor transporter ATP-binding protein EcfA2 [Hydrogenophaga laconesensis]|uniref:Energy-coupling factor transporter ATP-binding protein EcfA2 n=1 Tax=Hydrogenophaga laconesensis TaxID=1805971 RepID=A0ABU1VIB7_9BURK|nr:energy-coupling factor transporter ATP-binding protein EcfA2 [Hydrogenophaga laconesensis]